MGGTGFVRKSEHITEKYYGLEVVQHNSNNKSSDRIREILDRKELKQLVSTRYKKYTRYKRRERRERDLQMETLCCRAICTRSARLIRSYRSEAKVFKCFL